MSKNGYDVSAKTFLVLTALACFISGTLVLTRVFTKEQTIYIMPFEIILGFGLLIASLFFLLDGLELGGENKT